jgi:hypothetical protein
MRTKRCNITDVGQPNKKSDFKKSTILDVVLFFETCFFGVT